MHLKQHMYSSSTGMLINLHRDSFSLSCDNDGTPSDFLLLHYNSASIASKVCLRLNQQTLKSNKRKKDYRKERK